MSVWPTPRSIASPASWPYSSLTCLRPSTSMVQMAKRCRGMVASSRSNSRRLRSPVRGSVAATSASRAMLSRSAVSVRRRSRTCPSWRPRSSMTSTEAAFSPPAPGPKRSMTPTTVSSTRMGKPAAAIRPRAIGTSRKPGSAARSGMITGATAAQTRPGRPVPSPTSRSCRSRWSSSISAAGAHQAPRRTSTPRSRSSSHASPPHSPRERATASRMRGAPASKVGVVLRMRVVAICMARSSSERRPAVMSRTRRTTRGLRRSRTVRVAISRESGRPSLATTRRRNLRPPASPEVAVNRAIPASRSSRGSRGAREAMASVSSGAYPVIAPQAALTFTGRPRSRTTIPCPRSPVASASDSQNRAWSPGRGRERPHLRARASAVVSRRAGRYRSAAATRPDKGHTSGHTGSALPHSARL